MHHVSVIVPARNRAKLVERAIRSVLAQTYQDFEIVIVDDGSTDNTPKSMAALAKRDQRVRVLRHHTNRGAQAARNTGIFAATGQWIAFLDSDDEWLRDSLELRLQAADRGKLRVIHSECYVTTDASKELRRWGSPALEGWVYESLLRKPGTLFPSLLVAKECLERIGYLDERIVSYQEWDTSIRLAKYYPFGFVPEPTFIYECRQEDSISKDVLRQARGYEQVFTKHFWSIGLVLGPQALVRHYQMAADVYFQAKDEDNGRRCLMKAFWLWPFRPRTILRGIHRVLRSGF